MLWLFLSLSLAVVVVDYSGGPVEGDAWITLALHADPRQLLTLQHVTWCKSFVPNDQEPPLLAADCSGRNLMRLQLYPGTDEAVLKEPPSQQKDSEIPVPGTFYIDPARVGGWDTRHQWNILVEISQRNGILYREAIRFNPLVPATTTPPPPITTTGEMPTESSSSTQGVTNQVPTSPPLVITVHSWKGALLVLSIGSFSVIALAGAVRFLRWQREPRVSLARHRDETRSRVYGGNYNWQQQEESIEMADFSAAEEDRLKKEDLQILEMIK